MRFLNTSDADVLALEATRASRWPLIFAAALVVAIASGVGPFAKLQTTERMFCAAVLAVMTLPIGLGRFGVIVDRRRRTVQNWYECLGVGICWTFPMRPAAVRLEWRMGGHRDVSDLVYVQHIFLLNEFGPPLRIGRVRTSAAAREIAATLADFLAIPIEEGSPRPGDQICVPRPWADWSRGFFSAARLYLGRNRTTVLP